MARKYIEPKPQIPFTITVKGTPIQGYLIATGHMLPFGIPDAFLVHLPHEPPMQLSIIDGEWRMAKVDPEVVKALGDWLEAYYE